MQVIFEGVWMGLLPESVSDLISEQSYGEGVAYTGAAYIDSGLQFWENLIVDRHFGAGGRVLVAAAGGGREIIALTRKGFAADGFECSRAMVTAGRKALAERMIQARLDWAPPCRIPEIQDTYDALIIGWNGYTYISPRERRIDFMKALGAHLRPGSPVLVSAAIGSARSGLAIWTPRVANAVRVCTFRRPVFDRGATFPGRPRHEFTRRQLENELAEAGFSPAAFYRWGDFGAVVCFKSEPGATALRSQENRAAQTV